MITVHKFIRILQFAVFAFVLLFFLFLIVININSGTNTAGNEQQENVNTACINSTITTCYIGNCSGTMTCINERWGNCIVEAVCAPGSTAPCVEGGCACGIKKCNECGTGYGECINATKK